MNNSAAHTALIRRIRLAIQKRLGDDAISFTRSNGVAEIGGHTVAFGIPGAADIFGWRKSKSGPAISFEIEGKTRTGSLQPNQQKWREICNKLGIPYLLVHVDDEKQINQAADDAAEWVNRLGQQ